MFLVDILLNSLCRKRESEFRIKPSYEQGIPQSWLNWLKRISLVTSTAGSGFAAVANRFLARIFLLSQSLGRIKSRWSRGLATFSSRMKVSPRYVSLPKLSSRNFDFNTTVDIAVWRPIRNSCGTMLSENDRSFNPVIFLACTSASSISISLDRDHQLEKRRIKFRCDIRSELPINPELCFLNLQHTTYIFQNTQCNFENSLYFHVSV